jgi:DNA-binding FadR family transcriptional regulator
VSAFKGVVRQPVYLQVAEQLREAILDGTLADGEVLPAERELCERFGVSRTSVREALRALQAQGLVVAAGPNAPLRVAGAEAYSVATVRSSLDHLLRLGGVPLADLVELRVALEAAVVECAARRLPRPDLAPAHAEIGAMHAAALDVAAFEEADVRFHLALAVASGNRALELVMIAVRDSVASHLLEALQALRDPGATLERLVREHEAILAAVAERDAERAGELMRDHILGLYQEALR